MFEKLKVAKLKNDLLYNLRVEVKNIIKKELESFHINSTCPTTNFNSNYITKIESLKRELDITYLIGRKSRHKISSVKNFATGKIIRHFLPTNFFA